MSSFEGVKWLPWETKMQCIMRSSDLFHSREALILFFHPMDGNLFTGEASLDKRFLCAHTKSRLRSPALGLTCMKSEAHGSVFDRLSAPERDEALDAPFRFTSAQMSPGGPQGRRFFAGYQPLQSLSTGLKGKPSDPHVRFATTA